MKKTVALTKMWKQAKKHQSIGFLCMTNFQIISKWKFLGIAARIFVLSIKRKIIPCALSSLFLLIRRILMKDEHEKEIFPLNPMNVLKMFLWQRQSTSPFLTMSSKLVFSVVGDRFLYLNLNPIFYHWKINKKKFFIIWRHFGSMKSI